LIGGIFSDFGADHSPHQRLKFVLQDLDVGLERRDFALELLAAALPFAVVLAPRHWGQ
jgi:hypothetical protein